MNNITSTESLKTSIFNATPDANLTAIEELCLLTIKHNLKWVSRKDGTDAFYVMSQLAESKGLDKEDYRKHWSTEGKCTSAAKGRESEPLPGKALLLKGKELANFKTVYEELYGDKLGRAPAIWVGSWEHAYAYLVQGRSEVAKDFQNLGAKAVETSVTREIEDLQKPIETVTRTHLYQSGWSKEEYLQRDLCYLASMTPYKVSAEVAVIDYPGSKTETRRFDLVHIQPHKTKGKIVTCYELKKDIISLEDLIMTVDAKRYVELLKDRYNTQHVNLIMVAPYGGTAEALERCQQPNYDQVEIQTVRKFTQFLLEKARAYHTKDTYFVDSVLVGQNETVKALLVSPREVQELKKVIPFPIKKLAA